MIKQTVPPDRLQTNEIPKDDKFDVVGKCSCGKPILRYMLEFSQTMCADCAIMWSNEARFMQQ